jgi:hypothetical protein
LQISDILLEDTKDTIKKRIIQKLEAARKLIDFDKEVSAGIYVYAVEELGKLEVLMLIGPFLETILQNSRKPKNT